MAFYDPEELQLRLAPLEPSSLVALAAASAERVNPVYETYWAGDHIDEVKEAIELGWQSCAGKTLDATRLQHVAKFVRDHLDWLHEEGIGILASSVTVCLRVLEALNPNKDEAVQGVIRAFGSSLQVVKIAAKLAKVDKTAAQDEELSWQDRAITLVSGSPGPWDASMFRQLGAAPPHWWTAYASGSEHLV